MEPHTDLVAMHMSDGIVNAPTSVIFGLVAVLGLAVCVARAQSGSVGILQIPPMDLGQVEVIKGVAAALYGMSAIGGVVNLVSRRPTVAEHQFLVNRTSHRGTDTALWVARPLAGQWNYSVLGGAHWQEHTDTIAASGLVNTQVGPGEFLENFAIWSEPIKSTRRVREP